MTTEPSQQPGMENMMMMKKKSGRPLRQGREYHFNVIYNHARCPLSVTQDTQLSLAWTRRAVDILRQHGLLSSYYHDRDCPKGLGMAQELSRVIRASEMTVILLSPGFVRDCWPRYCLLTCFRSLFQSSPTSSSSTFSTASQSRSSSASPLAPTSTWAVSSRSVSPSSADGAGGNCEVLLVALGLQEEDLPVMLKDLDVLFFPQAWQHDPKAWLCLEGALGLEPLPATYWEERREVTQTESPVPPLPPSLSADSPRPDRLQTRSPSPRSPSSLASTGDRTHRQEDSAQVSEDSAICEDDDDGFTDTGSREDGIRNLEAFLDLKMNKQMGNPNWCSQRVKEEEERAVEEKRTRESRVQTGGDDVEAAVLDRLCHAGLRRESLEENSITRVFVHGNTVSIDTLRTSRPSRQRDQSPGGITEDRLTESKSSSGKKEREALNIVGDEVKSNVQFSRIGFKEARKSAVNSPKPGVFSSEDQAVSTQSPRRKLQYSEEYDSPSEASCSMSLTTQNYERSTTSQRSSPRNDVPLTARTETHVEESVRMSSPLLTSSETTTSSQETGHSYRVYSLQREGRRRSPRKDEVDSSLLSPALSPSTTAPSDSCKYDHIIQHTDADLSRRVMEMKDTSRRRKDKHDPSVHVSTGNVLNSKKEIRHQPHEYLNVLVCESQSSRNEVTQRMSGDKVQQTMSRNEAADTVPRKEVEETVLRKEHTMLRKEVEETMLRTETQQTTSQQRADKTTSHSHFITSIEDEQDMATNNFSGSWSHSDYGTMSPRNDLSSVSHDSGFLSTGLASFRSTQTHDSTPKNPDHRLFPEEDGDRQTSNHGASITLMKKVQEEGTKYNMGLLEKSDMTSTSFGRDKTLLSHNHSQSADKLDGPFVTCFSQSEFVDQSSDVTVKTSPRINESIDSKETLAAESDKRKLKVLPAQCDVRDRKTEADVIRRSTSAGDRCSTVEDDDVRHASKRRESWIWEDVDANWSIHPLLLPLYHILCYALTRPELPYF